MQHLDEGTIHAWLDGALDAEESARVEQHAGECGECAAAVAEARGLVAGASRILSALDQVPRVAGGGGGAGGSSYRSRSLWGRLHLTPLRAAAAALVFLAAGTVLVVRETPNADQAMMALDTARKVVPVSAPNAQPPRAATEVRAAQVASGAEAKSVAAASPVSPKRENAALRTEVARSAAVAQKLPSRAPTVADSISVAAVNASARDVPVDSVSIRERHVADATKRSAAPAAVVGGVVQPAPAPALAPRGYANIAPSTVPSYVGCYAVSADSAAALPPQLALDSTRAVSLGEAAAGVSGRAQRPAMAKAAEVSHAVSALFGNTRQPLSNASWQPLPSGGVRLSIDSPMRTVLLQRTPSADLSGSTMISGRVISVTLRRVECR